MKLGLGLGLEMPRGALGPAFDPDAEAFFARTSVPDARKAIINQTILMLKDGGGWGKDDGFYMTAAHSLDAARTNWVGSSYKMSLFNVPTFLADRYIKGDGSTSYGTTGYNPNTAPGAKYAQNDAHQAIFCRDDQAITRFACGHSRALLVPRLGTPTDAAAIRCNQTAGQNYTLPAATSVGYLIYGRDNASDFRVKKDGAAPTTIVQASAGLAIAGDFMLCAASTTGNAATNFDPHEICHWSFGGNLSNTEMEKRRLAVVYYLTAIGAI